MVRALLDGSKTQTRRIVKGEALKWLAPGMFEPAFVVNPENGLCPFGKPGDRLYVRETWAQPTALDPGPTVYRADYQACVPAGFENVPPAESITWKPSIHMPRTLSRITLEVTGVRIARLHDITDADALAEGVDRTNTSIPGYARERFVRLWTSINGNESWALDPWVWVVEFKRVTP